MQCLVTTAVLLAALLHCGTCQVRSENPCKRRGGTSAHEQYCDKFYECVGDDEVAVQSCPNGLVYAGRQALVDVCGYDHEYQCQEGQLRSRTQRSPSADPCQAPTGVVAHGDYCDRYLECYQGEVYEVDCPNGLVFSDRHILLDHCVYPHENLYACIDKKLGNEPIPTEHCDWLYGIFGHETSCTRYWTCWNGTAIEQFCIGGLLFNEKTHSCDWPEFVEDCQKHPLCVEDANGNVPLGKSCERYWGCQGGYPRLMRCPATLVFDKISRRCVHPPTDDCDVPPTEEPEELIEDRPIQRPASSGNRGRRPSRPRPTPPPQQIDVDADVEYVYDDEEPLDSGFSAPPQRAEVRPAPGRGRGQQPISFPRRQSNSGGRAPLRGPSIPNGATLVN